MGEIYKILPKTAHICERLCVQNQATNRYALIDVVTFLLKVSLAPCLGQGK